MGVSHLITYLLLASPLLGQIPKDQGGQILYLVYRGQINQAFQEYLNWKQTSNTDDFSLLQQTAIQLLEEGMRSRDPEIETMCMFGAGIAMTPALISILEKGIWSAEIKTQLIALSFLAKLDDHVSDLILLEALNSPFLLIRLEALLCLAKKNHPSTLGHLQSILVKIPPPLRALVPQIAALLEGTQATSLMRQFLSDSELEVRLQALIQIGENERDDFLPQIRSLICQPLHPQQECCVSILGKLKDYSSLAVIEKLAGHKQENVRLAAVFALCQLDQWDKLEMLTQAAKEGNLFAISALGELKEGSIILKELLNNSNRDIRFNAAIALLKNKEWPSTEVLFEIFSQEKKDIGFCRILTPGKSLSAWKTVPSISQKIETHPQLRAETLAFRESVLVACLELEENDFLEVAQYVLKEHHSDLVPLIMETLKSRPTEKVIQFLYETAQKTGAPFIRSYCTLTLYKLTAKKEIEQALVAWLKEMVGHELIRFIEKESAKSPSFYDLAPHETSQLLIETFETLARSQNKEALEAILHAIACGNVKNRYALAGLLLRMTE